MEALMNARRGFSVDSPPGDSEDLDFNDVFGGPPKRFSTQEVRLRYSLGDSEEDTGTSSHRIALKEKPVFGEESSGRRRRQGDDFFDDIFRVDESHGSPRRTDNLIGSSPGSRIMSPARVFSPNAEPYGTSLPAQFSLPPKLTKGTEFPTFPSPNHGPHKMDATTNGLNSSHSSSASLSRFSNQAIRGEEIKNEARAVYDQSPLSREASFRRQGSKKDTKSVDINQFHFSIYKWAGKGVPMLMPLVGRNNLRSKDIIRNEPSKKVETESLKTEIKKNDSRGREIKSQENEKESVHLVAARQDIQTKQVKTVDEIGIVKNVDKKVSLKIEESLEFEVKPLRAWINNEVDQPGEFCLSPERTQSDVGKNIKKNEGARIDSDRENPNEFSLQGNVMEMKENKSRSQKRTPSGAEKNAKKNEGARIDSNRANLDECSLQDAAINSQTSPGKSRVKGKVRDFVHIFNQEADSSPKADFQTKNSSSRWKAVNIDQKQNVDENLNKDEAQQYTSTNTSVHRKDHLSTNQKSAYSSESLNQDSRTSVENSDDPFEDNFLVQEISDDLEKATGSNEGSEDMKDIDAKIRQWSFGRKGNIRSLLSTLQLVLWPGSGWKAVPLMDLIEANSVKRAYQKALLRLHPDKLQQKGADSHHKYIAEKVFDILQEAWDHFNTLAPL
ncbi:hypothetical protein BUALT_Bualt01G0034100 [Buddleja alternifolia]|uniref:J domain-containing protein required for chloroplast accumulation response 1 n=1 Tax=Buddleja alternifolia TaxID=168488 RepID=A0AAV6YEN7_9LAMI|nr:hypothetical protein BUALT_Bualt01G0034100 [Buddleja alternifolia]